MSHKWLETPTGHFEMENGVLTGKSHNSTYHEAHGHVVKINHAPDGTSTAEIFSPRKAVVVNDVTGDVVAINIGFSLQRELTGATAISGAAGHSAVELTSADIPFGLGVNTHRWDKVKKKLVAK